MWFLQAKTDYGVSVIRADIDSMEIPAPLLASLPNCLFDTFTLFVTDG